MNFKALIAIGALSTALIAGAASAQTVTLPNGTTVTSPVAQMSPMPGNHMRGEWRSNRNIRAVRTRLERVIDSLQRDRHDYGGHRELALDALQKARAELLAAEQYEQSHPGQ